MSEQNACVFCSREQGVLPNGESGPWCQHFNEPIKFDGRDSDYYAGMNSYSHSGRANGHQDYCEGFQLDPKMRSVWESYGFNSSAESMPVGAASAAKSIRGVAGFVVRVVVAIIIPIVLAVIFGGFLGGRNGDLAVGFIFSLVVCAIIAFRWKSLGFARIVIVGVPLLFAIAAAA